MDSNLEKRYCKHRLRKPRKNSNKHCSHTDIEQKDERQFKLERFVKDIQAFRKHEQSKKKNDEKHTNDADQENIFKDKTKKKNVGKHANYADQENIIKNKTKKNHQHTFAHRDIASKDKVRRKRGFFDYGQMTSTFTRGLLGGPLNARFDQDLCKVIGLANLNNPKINNKPKTVISNIQNEETEQEDSPSIYNKIDLGACSTVTTIPNVKESNTKNPSLEKESYPEFTRLINQSLALEKYKSFKNENYAKDIKICLRNMYLKRLNKPQSEEPLSIKNSFSGISSASPTPLIFSPVYPEENDLQNIKLKYKSATEYLKETLGSSLSMPLEKSPEAKHSPYIRPTFAQDRLRFYKSNTSNVDHRSLQNRCGVEHIKHPVSKLPFPQEYLQTSLSHHKTSQSNTSNVDHRSLQNRCGVDHIKHPVSKLPFPQEYLQTSLSHHKTSPVLCLPHPAAEFLDSQYVRPHYPPTHSYGKQTSQEIIDGCGDRLHQPYQSSLFSLPPAEPSPEFQHYPFQMF